CNAIKTGQDLYGPHNVSHFYNAAAFTQPCVLASNGQPDPANSPAGCVPLTGIAVLGGGPTQVAGPGFHRLDFSTFKEFPFQDRFRLQFRAEFFNILNHPNFNAPGFGGNGVVSIPGATNFTNPNFGAIGSTRDAPYDPRQIQFALKLYYRVLVTEFRGEASGESLFAESRLCRSKVACSAESGRMRRL
ncbi:MAG TPA: hypothetical protein VM912_14555, partial [Terriglobales bacterium]|nr:hypothetical protein [Terriglobales bacterium]